MICPHCQTENRTNAKFCDECGASLTQAAAPGDPAFLASLEAKATQSRIAALEIPELELSDDDAGETEPSFVEGAVEPSEVREAKPAQSSGSSAGEEAQDEGAEAPREGCEVAEEAQDQPNELGVELVDEQTQDHSDEPSHAIEENSESPVHGDELAAEDTLAGDGQESEDTQDDPDSTNEIPRIEDPTEEELQATTEEDNFSGLEFSGFKPETESYEGSDAGDTLKMPVVGSQDDSPQNKSFVAPASDKEAKKQKRLQEKEAKRQKKAAQAGEGKAASKLGKGAKIAIAAVVALVLVAAAGAAVSYQMEMWGGKTIPDVAGMTQTDATYLLESKGFKVRSTQVSSDETEGLVLLADPSTGARQPEGSEVVIHVAVARTIPNIEGMTESAAVSALTEAGFDKYVVRKQKSDDDAGKIIAVEPTEGSKAKSSTTVTLTETEPYVVPTVQGMSWDAAKAAIEQEGFVAAYTEEYSETLAAGTIMYTSPEEGSVAKSGSTVNVVVAKSRGAELVAVTKQNLVGYQTTGANGQALTINSVSYAQYDGNGWVSFTATGSYSVTVSVGSTTQTVTSDGETLTGYALFDSANNMTSVNITG